MLKLKFSDRIARPCSKVNSKLFDEGTLYFMLIVFLHKLVIFIE